ncbi:MAG: hypothetical protein ACRDP6_01210 [Actinoallomurus sp.]
MRREPVPGAAEPDETSVRDLGGERLAVADREERVVLSVATRSGWLRASSWAI